MFVEFQEFSPGGSVYFLYFFDDRVLFCWIEELFDDGGSVHKEFLIAHDARDVFADSRRFAKVAIGMNIIKLYLEKYDPCIDSRKNIQFTMETIL